MPNKVSIVGAAGTLGSCAAYALATQGLCDELVLFDINENLLKCHVLDLETAVTSIQNVKVRAAESDEDLSGSQVVIVAAGTPWRFIESRMELLKDSLPIIKELAQTTFDEAMSIPLWSQVEIWAMTDKVHIEYGKFHPYHFMPGTAWLSK